MLSSHHVVKIDRASTKDGEPVGHTWELELYVRVRPGFRSTAVKEIDRAAKDATVAVLKLEGVN